MSGKASLWFTAMLFAVCFLADGQDTPLKSPRIQSFSQLGPEARRSGNNGGTAYKYHQQQQQQQAKSRLRRHRDRPESDDDDDLMQMVTIDLSALRPSLPGLVLYKYGELAPKLVQIDLDALNPKLQPHIIWPQFTKQMDDLGEGYYDFFRENLDPQEDIPFLGDRESLVPMHNKQFARMTSSSTEDVMPDFNDLAGGDIYDFLPGSFRNEEMMTLHNSLPLADEVIVPLDWEEEKSEKTSGKKKKNVFLSEGWKPGGEPHPHRSGDRNKSLGSRDLSTRGNESPTRVYPFGSNGWRPGKKSSSADSDIESEADDVSVSGKRNSQGSGSTRTDYSSRLQPIKTTTPGVRRGGGGKYRKPAQESWTLFRKPWGMLR